MKKRMGFVSNSSSSSFILKMEKPLTKKEAEKFFNEYSYEVGKEKKILTPKKMANWLVDRVEEVDFSTNSMDIWKLYMLVGEDGVDKFFGENEEEIKERTYQALNITKDEVEEAEKKSKFYEDKYREQLDYSFSNEKDSVKEKEFEKYSEESYELYEKFWEPYYEVLEKNIVTLFVEKNPEVIKEAKKLNFYRFEIEGQGNGWDGLESTSLYENQRNAFTEEFKKYLVKD